MNEPIVIPWCGRQVRVRHDDPLLEPHTRPRCRRCRPTLAMAGEDAEAVLAALLGSPCLTWRMGAELP